MAIYGMRVGSVCSGIGGGELAFSGIAEHVFASEVEAFPRAVLRHHFPDLTIHGDFTEIPASAGPVDVLVGGTPCQSFSVAGLRGGMADERGNLALEYLRLADRLRPAWVLWENVPGVLSSNEGRDFGAFVGGLAECGYGWAYRVLDAQYFGLAQRRKRVFVVGCLGDWRRAAAVLFEPASLRGDPAPGREAREGVAATLTQGTDSSGKGGYAGRRREDDTNLVAKALCGSDGGIDREDRHTLIAFDARQSDTDGESETFVAVSFHQNQRAEVTTNDTAGALNSGGGKPGQGYPAVAFQESQSGARTHDTHATLDANNGSRRHYGVATAQVRRLTPTECERLQGYPDGWTDIAWRGGRAADGPRYRALGNAFAVPVVRWIARQIAREHADLTQLAEAAD